MKWILLFDKSEFEVQMKVQLRGLSVTFCPISIQVISLCQTFAAAFFETEIIIVQSHGYTELVF